MGSQNRTTNSRQVARWSARISRHPPAVLLEPTAVAVKCDLPGTSSEQDDRGGLEHNLHILDQRIALDVLEVEAHLAAYIFDREVVVVVDLGPTGDPGTDQLPPLVSLVVLAK